MWTGPELCRMMYFVLVQDSNDLANIQLTPEQQRQLEEIEKMPLTMERGMFDLNDPDVGKTGACVFTIKL